MPIPIELYETLGINKIKESFDFPYTHTDAYKFNEGRINYTFLCIEIKSQFPPTDCVLQLSHSYQTKTNYDTLTIHFMKYRKTFIYENGLYILYFDDVEEISNEIVPIRCILENKRDENTTAKLFYRTNFNVSR